MDCNGSIRSQCVIQGDSRDHERAASLSKSGRSSSVGSSSPILARSHENVQHLFLQLIRNNMYP